MNPIKTTTRPIRLPEPLDTHYRQTESERLDETDGPCRCWTEPARVHSGHCCMAHADLWCHQDAGMAALNRAEGNDT